MRTFYIVAVFTAIALVSCQTWAQTGAPFSSMTKEKAFAATTSIGTAAQMVPTYGTQPATQYRIMTVGCTGVVSVILASSQAEATGAVPTPGVDQFTFTYPCPALEILTGPNNAWVNVITSTGTGTVYVIGGRGF